MDNEEAYEDNYYRDKPLGEVVANDVLTSEWWFRTYTHALGTARYSFGHTVPTPSVNDPQIIHALIAKAETKAALRHTVPTPSVNDPQIIITTGNKVRVIKAALRVAIKDDGLIDIIDFTLPSFKGKLRKNIAQKDAPAWVIRAICTLRIAQEGNYIDGLGLKVHDALYYLEPQEGEEESDDLEQRKESDQ